MKCARCKHDHKGEICRVMVTQIPPQALGGEYQSATTMPCGCPKFVEPEDLPVCPNCAEILTYSHSFAQIRPELPYLFVCIWCTGCKHIIAAQVTVALAPQPTKGQIV